MFFYREHNPPHFHVEYAEYKAQISIADLSVLEGSLPPAKLRRVRAWATTRRAALAKTWQIVVIDEGKPEPIS